MTSFLLAAVSGTVASLFCAHGSIGLVPNPIPSGYETQFAVAVVEITRSSPLKRASVSDFRLLDAEGDATVMQRVVSVETFGEPRAAGEAELGYYLNTADGSKSQSWDGTLPAGTTRLRIRVSFPTVPAATKSYSLVVGPYTISGPCEIEWPT